MTENLGTESNPPARKKYVRAVGPKLRILSINDVYELDHLPRLATLLRAHELPAPDVTISIVAGDFVGPSLLSSLDAGRGMGGRPTHGGPEWGGTPHLSRIRDSVR